MRGLVQSCITCMKVIGYDLDANDEDKQAITIGLDLGHHLSWGRRG